MQKHAFGNGVPCGKCGAVVDAVFAPSWELAHAGQGICETCLQATPVVSSPAPEVTDDTPQESEG